jgi:alkylation response protein AidB-like acyl-CoA dehydrogenase
MQLLTVERETLGTYLPKLSQALAGTSFAELERPASPGLKLFRDAGGPGLLVPREYCGRGASALDAVRIQRAIGSLSPSLAIATTMHHFSIASLVELSATGTGLEWMLLEAISQQDLLIASGFAEGQPGRSILSPTLDVRRNGSGLIVSGSKKPCSMAYSMDFLTASVALPAATGATPELAVVLVPGQAEGLERRPFWANTVLSGAESDEVVLRDVHVPDSLVFPAGDAAMLDPLQVSGFLWFELLMSASYLGVASALVERVIQARKGEAIERATLGIELEGAMSAVEGGARSLMAEAHGHDALARGLFIRYSVQRSIERVAALAAELLGGMAFVGSDEISYLLAASRALAFHPPSRSSMARPLADYLEGASLRIA